MSLNTEIVNSLNAQIEKEAYASHFYLAVAYWCGEKALEGCKEFFIRQFDEERMHMLKIYEYLSDAGYMPITPSIRQPRVEFDSVKELFEAVLAQEKSVTAAIHSIVKQCYEASDFATLNFLQWYVEEQREEEVLIQGILDRIDVIGEGSQSLYYVDNEVSAINAVELKKEEGA